MSAHPPKTDPLPAGAERPSEADRRLIAEARAQLGTSVAALINPLPPPDTFPGYEVIREVHRGGQGAVYQAIQKTTKRTVAIKVMHHGPLAGSAGRARFEREVQILGQLSHPNIVGVLDSGTTSGGTFYYVMEYVPGRTLDELISERSRAGTTKQGIDDTLKLFAKVCEAVNAAHLRGVIHRDLKPGNIKIAPDGEPVVVDFGLAKIAAPDVTEDEQPRLMTMTGQFIGSLPWASPEQAEGSPSGIDVRTDVYSLGVILYQLLTGRFPYQVAGNMRDVLDNILRAEPAKPSTVRRQINDEVETIVLKCLNKQRDRRYQTAGELARDIRRYLAGDPIEAKRDSGWYVVSKTVRRYKVQTTAGAAILAVIVVFGFVSFGLYRRAEGSAGLARSEAEVARIEKERAIQVQEVLEEILKGANPADRPRDVTVREVLAAAEPKIINQLKDDPEVLSEILDTIGLTYLNLGRADLAEPRLRRSLALREGFMEPDEEGFLHSLQGIAKALHHQGKLSEAEEMARRVLKVMEADPAVTPLRIAYAKNNLARILDQQPERLQDAEQLYRDAIRLLENDFDEESRRMSGIVMGHLGMLLTTMGRPDEAEVLLRRSAEALDDVDDRFEAAKTRTRQALLLAQRGKTEEARKVYENGLRELTASLDPDHPDLLAERGKSALMLFIGKEYEAAAAEYRVLMNEAAASNNSSSRLLAPVYRKSVGSCLYELGRHGEAEAELLPALAALEKDNRYPQEILKTRQRLVQVYEALGKPDEADKYR